MELTAEAILELEGILRRGIGPSTMEAQDDRNFLLYRHRDDEHVAVLDLVEKRLKYADHPTRAKGTIVLRNEQSFVDYVNDHKHPLFTAIFAEDRTVMAYFNHHERWEADLPSGDPTDEHGLFAPPVPDAAEEPAMLEAGWNDYAAKLELKYTPGWTAWVNFAQSGWMSQEDFANFLQENAGDVVEPEGGRLVEIVSNLRLSSESKIESRINLATGGVKLKFEEDFIPMGGDATERSQVEIPGIISVNLQVFDASPTYRLSAFLRYKPVQGQVLFQLKFTGEVTKVLDDAFDRMCETISAGTGLKVHAGHLGA